MLLHSKVIGTGKPFVILHGFLGMGDNWKTLANQFSDEGYQVHLVDQRNHGRSFHHNVFNYNVLSEDLKYYCEVNNLEDIVLLGHSMGGKTAMLFASQHQDIVSKLMIADIAPKFYPVHHQDILEGLSQINFNIVKTRTQADDVLRQYVFSKGVRQFLLKNLYWIEKGKLGLRMNLEVLKNQVSEIGQPLPNNAVYRKETLFLKGDKSSYIKDEDHANIKKHFTEAEIITISNSGHWLHAENSTDFFNVVVNFI